MYTVRTDEIILQFVTNKIIMKCTKQIQNDVAFVREIIKE